MPSLKGKPEGHPNPQSSRQFKKGGNSVPHSVKKNMLNIFCVRCNSRDKICSLYRLKTNSLLHSVPEHLAHYLTILNIQQILDEKMIGGHGHF